MGVADVHVAVDEAGRHHEVARVDHAIGARVRQLVGFSHAGDAPALDQDGPVADDPALIVDGDDVARALDLQTRLRHETPPASAVRIASHQRRGKLTTRPYSPGRELRARAAALSGDRLYAFRTNVSGCTATVGLNS